jgi:hypothetical protein
MLSTPPKKEAEIKAPGGSLSLLARSQIVKTKRFNPTQTANRLYEYVRIMAAIEPVLKLSQRAM